MIIIFTSNRIKKERLLGTRTENIRFDEEKKEVYI